MKVTRIFKYYFFKFIRLKGEPRSVALGMAIGVFIGVTPTIPLHTVTIIPATILTRSSTIAGLLGGLLACNPITYIPQYYFSMVVGNAITPYHLNWSRIKHVLDVLLSDQGFQASLKVIGDLGVETFVVMGVGGAVLALPFGVASYFISLKLLVTFKNKKNRKQLTI